MTHSQESSRLPPIKFPRKVVRKLEYDVSMPQVSRQITVGPADPARPLYQASSEYADATWTCLSIVTLECTSPAKRFPPKTVNEKKFHPTQSLTFILAKKQSDYYMVL